MTKNFEYLLIKNHTKYVFEVLKDQDKIIGEIDKNSLRLEKNEALKKSPRGLREVPKSPRGNKSPREVPKSPRGKQPNPIATSGPEFFEGENFTPKPKPSGERKKVASVDGSRFRVTWVDQGEESHVVAIINKEAITLVDPTRIVGEAKETKNAVYFKKCKWEKVKTITSSRSALKISTADGTTLHLKTKDAPQLLGEINSLRDGVSLTERVEKGENSDEEVLFW